MPTDQFDLYNSSQRLQIVKLTMKTNHINFGSKLVRRGKKKDTSYLTKVIMHPKDFITLHTYTPNLHAPGFIKQILLDAKMTLTITQ